MFLHQNIWLPDGEKHFPSWMDSSGEIVDGRGTYQIRKLRAAMEYVKHFRTAGDVGGHVGLWAMQLAKRFRVVHSFEPVEKMRECFRKNVEAEVNQVILHEYAIGSSPGRVALEIPTLDGGLDTGGTHVVGEGDIELRTLDSFELEDLDFLKIDVEGLEHHVIEGARETILRCKPCIIVEQKQHIMGRNYGTSGTPAVDMILEMGAKQRAVLSGDHILSWD